MVIPCRPHMSSQLHAWLLLSTGRGLFPFFFTQDTMVRSPTEAEFPCISAWSIYTLTGQLKGVDCTQQLVVTEDGWQSDVRLLSLITEFSCIAELESVSMDLSISPTIRKVVVMPDLMQASWLRKNLSELSVTFVICYVSTFFPPLASPKILRMHAPRILIYLLFVAYVHLQHHWNECLGWIQGMRWHLCQWDNFDTLHQPCKRRGLTLVDGNVKPEISSWSGW